MAKSKKQQAAIAISMKSAGKKPKMKTGGSFPDLTGDGKVTRADVLKGRGVFKGGGSVKSKNKSLPKAFLGMVAAPFMLKRMNKNLEKMQGNLKSALPLVGGAMGVPGMKKGGVVKSKMAKRK